MEVPGQRITRPDFRPMAESTTHTPAGDDVLRDITLPTLGRGRVLVVLGRRPAVEREPQHLPLLDPREPPPCASSAGLVSQIVSESRCSLSS